MASNIVLINQCIWFAERAKQEQELRKTEQQEFLRFLDDLHNDVEKRKSK